MNQQATADDYVAGRVPIEAVLDHIPDEATREFELILTTLASGHERTRLVADLRRVLAESDDPVVRYAAFYGLHISLRRSKDYSLLEDLINEYQPVFGDHVTFRHLVVLFNIERGLGKQKNEIVAMAYDDSEQFAHNAGFVHLFADSVATLCEESDDDVAANLAAEWLPRATAAADQAIALDRRYAKYYCTKGRLLALAGEHDNGLALVKTAIDMEDSSRSDYAIRIGNYQYYRLLIQARRNEEIIGARMEDNAAQLLAEQEAVKKDLASAVRHMDESTLKNLEFLGFFAGLISFTIGSIQIAAHQDVNASARLIVVLMGALLVSFAGFSSILDRATRHTTMRAVIVGVVGAAVLVVGLVR
jgi:hypothetical protein